MENINNEIKEYIFEYDLGLDMNPVMGKLIIDENGLIRAEEAGWVKFRLNASDMKETIVMPGVGCGLLYAEFEDESTQDRVLCRFTMSGLKSAGEFCKIVDYYKATGTLFIPEVVEKHDCEKCGRPLVTDISVCVFCYNKFSVMKRALSFLKPYKWRVTISQILNAITLLGLLMSPLFARYLIDNHFEPQVGTWGQISLVAGAMFLTRAVAEVITIFAGRMFNKATFQVSNDLRAATYAKLQSHSMTLFAKRTPGDLIRRIMDDSGVVTEFITDLGRWVIEMILLFTVAITILLFTNWRLALLVFIPVPIVMLLMHASLSFIRVRFERQWRKGSRTNSILHDIIKGIRTVKSFGNEKREIDRFATANKELAQISSENEVYWGIMFQPLSFLISMGEFLILFVGGWMVLNGTLSIGELIQFTMFLWAIYNPLRWLVNVPRWLANTTTSMVKIFEILDEESEITQVKEPQNVPIAGSVSLDNVHFGYKSYEPVLKSVSLEINPGEMIGLVGKSGVGKSTLINLIMRLYDPNTGSVKINNVDLRHMSTDHLHENMGVVFQDSFLFAGTFFDNIAYGKYGATYEEVIAAAKAANAHDFITQTPDGYNTLIGEGGFSLSGGERQRLSIARAIIKNPEILILDEATSSLDVETESIIQESLNRITEGRTTIAIAHRLSTLRNANRLIVLDNKGVAEVGTHSELLRKRGIYFDLVMAQRQSSRKIEE